MPVFCSSRLESSKDHTDKVGDTVDQMFNISIFQSRYLLFLHDLAAFYEKSAQTKKEEIEQMEAGKCLEHGYWI